jgi:peptidoglycan hydrolase CwlO-like protein
MTSYRNVKARMPLCRNVLYLCSALTLVCWIVTALHAPTNDSRPTLVSVVYAEETKEERRARLEAELRGVEAQISNQQQLVEAKQGERRTLERDVIILDAKIKKAQLGIKARTLAIQQLGTQIGDKQIVINELNDRMKRQRISLAQLLRKTNELDDFTLVEVMLGEFNLSKFFEDADRFTVVKESLRQSYHDLTDMKLMTEDQKVSLQDKQIDEVELKKLQELEKGELDDREGEKTKILKVTRGQEAKYQALLKEQQKTASQIRAMLFELRDSTAIPFPDAVNLAKYASAKTGVRAALILGILTQETRLGANLGAPGAWASDMHPTRDQPIFKVITTTLGLDPKTLPVSRAPSYGYGGAMGPGQFIPSTWAIYGGYVKDSAGNWQYSKDRDTIRAMNGKDSPSNPYNNLDAFIATGLLMRDNGASAQTYAAERMAALRYFAGGNASNPAYAFYGDGVMGHTARIEEQIKILEGG